MKHPRTKRILKETEGQEIAEAAFVLPIVFLLLIGIYWVGRAYNIYSTINHAAREGARFATVSPCASCTPAAALTAADIAPVVTQTLQASHIDPSQIGPTLYPATPPVLCPGVPITSCTTNNQIRFCNGVELNVSAVNAGAQAVCGVSVSFQYPFNFSIPFTSISNIQLKADVQMQEEN